MNTKTKKPISILIVQILLVLSAVFLVLGIILGVMAIPDADNAGVPLTSIVLRLIVNVVFIALIVYVYIAIKNRNRQGKLISIVTILLLWGLTLYVFHASSGARSGMSPSELRGAGMIQVLANIFYIAILISVSASKKVRIYFSDSSQNDQK